MEFRVLGPFELPRDGRRIRRTPLDRRRFWQTVEAVVPGLSAACGCYVFSIRGKAWYVGLAQRQSFRSECFQPHKLMLYNEALDGVSGRTSLVFLAKITNKGRFSKPTKNRYPAIEFLESMLIGLGVRRNRHLMNIKGTKFLRAMRVPGLLNGGKGRARATAVRSMKKALGV